MSLPARLDVDIYRAYREELLRRPGLHLADFLEERDRARDVAAGDAPVGQADEPAAPEPRRDTAKRGGTWWTNANIQKPVIDGIRFDSGTEARRYRELRDDPAVFRLVVHPLVELPGGVVKRWDFLVRPREGQPWYEEIKGRKPGTDLMNLVRVHREVRPEPLRVLVWRGKKDGWEEL